MSEKLRINEIELDGGTQARAGLNDATVTEYRALVEESQQASAETGEITWPFRDPIEIYYDGDRYWLADGFHRVAACRQAGRYVVQANIRQGTRRDAILFAAGANADHGLRRTDTDKRRAVQRLLDDPEWSLWSDREIARACKVSHPFVARLRSFMPPAVTGNVTSERERTYTTKHGTTAVMNTANIGRQPEYKQVLPELVYGWLKNYRDDKGRIWRDLEDTQVHHRNSPCFQAYIEQFPNLTDPKFYLKQALARLKREDKAETAVPAPVQIEGLVTRAANDVIDDDSPSVNEYAAVFSRWLDDGPDDPDWHHLERRTSGIPQGLIGDALRSCYRRLLPLETAVPDESPFYVGPNAQGPEVREALSRYLDQWPDNRHFMIRCLANRESSRYTEMMNEAAAALGSSDMFIWHQAMILRNDIPALQKDNRPYSEIADEIITERIDLWRGLAVSPGSAAPVDVATYWLRNYVDPVHNRRWVDIEDSQIYGKKSDVCMAFKKQHPDIGDHSELLKNALAVLKQERAAEFTESIKALWDATLRLVARAYARELAGQLNFAAMQLHKGYEMARETAVSKEVES